MSAIFYVLRNGCQWNALTSLGASSTVHDRFQEWRSAGALLNVCALMVYLYIIKRLELIGNGKLWMVLLQRHLLGVLLSNPIDC
jgi:hypothetical protein